jgi:VanZ family protein
VLGFLLMRATGAEWASLALGIAYAISDEAHQHFVPGRLGSPLDVAIDAIGVSVGVLLARHYHLRRGTAEGRR